MKQLIAAALLLICHHTSNAQHDWQWLNPKPSGNYNIKITFTDSQHGFILNGNGDLFRTGDQGVHWAMTDHFAQATCMDIADSTGVVACSNGFLYVSSDNGATWKESPSRQGYIKYLSIVSRDTFFLAAESGLIYKTTDRGNTMTYVDSHFGIASFLFLDSKTGFIGGSGSTILKTTNGGQNWIKKDSVNFTPSGILSFYFLNADTGFAYREWSSLLKTNDGGNTWREFNTGSSVPVIQFVNEKTGFAGGDDGVIYRSDDSGSTWTSITPPDGGRYGYQIFSIYFLNENTGFLVGGLGRILKTIDGGQTWAQYSPVYTPITAVSFPTALTGYMSTWNYTFRTTDGGQSWDSLSLTTGTDFGSSSRFSQAHFSSADTGYFFSTNPVREHRTTDGGQTWTHFNPTVADWESTPGEFYIGQHTGFVSLQASGNSQLLKTYDDGASWSLVWQAQYSNESLGHIFFIDSLNGYATRYDGLLKTTDGGINWSVAFAEQFNSINNLWFFDPQNGFIFGDQGGIRVTHNGGTSFSNVIFTPQEYVGSINTVRFFNKQIGYMTAGNAFGPASYGQIYKTMNGGQTWQLNGKMGGNSIVFTPDSSIVIAGFGGEVVKNNIRNWQVDSLTVVDDNACGENFSVYVGAALSDADSISILYTAPNGKTDTVAATPNHVQNAVIKCTASAKAFIPDVVYTARVRLLYNGLYQQSDPIYFTPIGVYQPAIKDSAGYLVSTTDSANHWFRNGVAIPTALSRRYYPDSSGVYTVQTILDSCISAMSDPVTITLTCSSQQPVAPPIVTANAGVLTSSAAKGNHWFLNGIEIPDAYDQQYTPLVSGDYSVRIYTSCTISPMSNITNSVVNNNGPALHVFPNPVTDHLVIDNAEIAPLEFEILNINGHSMLKGQSSNNQIYINTRNLPLGQYILRVINRDTNSTNSVSFLKQ